MKATWNIVSFKWVRGNWRYCTSADTLAARSVKDIKQRGVSYLAQLECNQAITTLGVDIEHGCKMPNPPEAATKWAYQMQVAKLPRDDSWVAFGKPFLILSQIQT